MPGRVPWYIFLFPLLVVVQPAVHAGKPGARADARFLRLRCDDDGTPVAMETSVTSLSPRKNVEGDYRVDLVGAVHVADRGYYERLNRLFRKYDAVLYELVAPRGTRIPPGGGQSQSTVSYMQDGLTGMLGLCFQLKCIDYTPQNLVHADMTPDEFRDTMRQRGESFSQLFFRMMGQAMAQQSQDPVGSSDWKLISALLAKDRRNQLKHIMAEQFAEMDGAMVVFSGPDGSTLITERNKKALSVLRQQLALGRKRVAIFYGAGHMADMEHRLKDQFDLKVTGRFWLTAWDLTRRAAAVNSAPLGGK